MRKKCVPGIIPIAGPASRPGLEPAHVDGSRRLRRR